MNALPRAAVLLTPPTRRLLGRRWERIREVLSGIFSHSPHFEVSDPEVAARHVREVDPDYVVAAGGDGTVNLALQGLRPQDRLAVLPLGTANDLARFLELPLDGERLQLQNQRSIDILRVNGTRFCTTGGLGLPADIAHRVNELRTASSGVNRVYGKIGRAIYSTVATQALVRAPRLYELRMRYTEPGSDVVKEQIVQAHGVFVANQATFAGRMSVVPDAVNDDGTFEIGVLNARGRRGMLRLLSRLALGKLPAPGEVTTLRATAASVEVDTSVRFFGDGEVLQYASHFELGVEQGALSVVH